MKKAISVKRCLAVLMSITLLIGILPTVALAADSWDGSSVNTSWYNTTDTSFSISTGAELAGLATIVNGTASGITADTFSGKTVTLTNDIDLGSNNSWTPIGNSASYYFAGTFDGGGHTISNLYYNNSAGSYVGLFGYLGTTGACVVKDVCLADVNISGNQYIGGIADI
jgi:hypothetical protein